MELSAGFADSEKTGLLPMHVYPFDY
jgi:hypothetical protein